MRKIVLLCTAGSMGIFLMGDRSSAALPGGERAFSIEERLSLRSLPPKIDDLRIWIPVPSDSEWQAVNDLKVAGPFTARFMTENAYGNKILYLASKRGVSAGEQHDIVVTYTVRRKERGASIDAPDDMKGLSRYLKADASVPVDGAVKELAEKITRGAADDMGKARAIYDYLIRNVTYAKDDPAICGIGNSLVTLKHMRGMCTDWHSLFISLARSLGIPAKFEIGFPVTEGKREDTIAGYHCWAAFYVKGRGWIPVDASEAYKHPEKHDYFFGHIDENRFTVSTGRDITLENSNTREQVNFFVYPRIEVNGLEHKEMGFRVSFKEPGRGGGGGD